MCGITGYSTLKEVKLSPVKRQIRANIAKALLIANESRGVDSTGVFLQNGKYHVLSKDTCSATKFVREKDVVKIFEKDSHIMLGHTRQATTGTINKNNAHPFIKDNIVGIHNGVVSNHEEVAKLNKFKVEVDSEVIFELLNKNENDFKKTFEEIRGSASLAWFNKLEPNTLYLVAHDNPLSVAQVPFLETIFFSSEFPALDSVLQASVGTNNYNIWEIAEDVVLKITPEHEIIKTKVSFAEFTQYDWRANTNYQEPDNKADNKTLTEPTVDDARIDTEELKYLREIGKKSGCTKCHKPLLQWAYLAEFEDDLLFCLNCVPVEEAQNYVWVNLDTGDYTVVL